PRGPGERRPLSCLTVHAPILAPLSSGIVYLSVAYAIGDPRGGPPAFASLCQRGGSGVDWCSRIKRPETPAAINRNASPATSSFVISPPMPIASAPPLRASSRARCSSQRAYVALRLVVAHALTLGLRYSSGDGWAQEHEAPAVNLAPVRMAHDAGA